MGSNALKATILDRGHAKEASRGVESHFAAQGTARQRIRQRGGSGGAADPAAGGAAAGAPCVARFCFFTSIRTLIAKRY